MKTILRSVLVSAVAVVADRACPVITASGGIL